MKVDPRIALGLNLIALALVAIQLKVLTAESLAVLLFNLFSLLAALLADTTGSFSGRKSRRCDRCDGDEPPDPTPPRGSSKNDGPGSSSTV